MLEEKLKTLAGLSNEFVEKCKAVTNEIIKFESSIQRLSVTVDAAYEISHDEIIGWVGDKKQVVFYDGERKVTRLIGTSMQIREKMLPYLPLLLDRIIEQFQLLLKKESSNVNLLAKAKQSVISRNEPQNDIDDDGEDEKPVRSRVAKARKRRKTNARGTNRVKKDTEAT